jgi:hypothetical protein
MFEDILGIDSPQPRQEEFNFEGCPLCGAINIEEDGAGTFPHAKQFDQPMVCNSCGGKWTVEYDEDLEIKNVDY